MRANLLLAAAPDGIWQPLFELLLLLGGAMVLGAVAERLRQSAIVGYLIAGTLIGPGVLGWVSSQRHIFGIAELGVALLLFTIGLEFSPKRLVSLGRVPLVAGPLQVALTVMIVAAGCRLFGLEWVESVVIGSMIALSSTACVLRLLADRGEIDSPYGRVSLGILLVQDAAVVPLMLLVTVLASGGTPASMLQQLGLAAASALALILVFYAFFNHVAPRMLRMRTWRRNRDLPILLAVVMGIGSAWLAHAVNVSPAMGAFVAGVLLAVSPFAVQIRADIEPLKTVLVTLFFAAVGMFGDLSWLVQHVWLVAGIVVAVILSKALVVLSVVLIAGGRTQFAVASALCLAQVGEFSFVLASIAHGEPPTEGLLSDLPFQATVSATIISLLMAPYLIAVAPHIGVWCERMLYRLFRAERGASAASLQHASVPFEHASGERDLILVIGFGPAGQRVVEDLLSDYANRLVILDINPDNLEIARRYGVVAYIGDAVQSEILEHSGIHRAHVVVITVPSPLTSRRLVQTVRQLAPGAMIVVRSRYHLHRWQLMHSGAHIVVDEEDRVGHQLAAEVLGVLGQREGGRQTTTGDEAAG